MEKKQVRRINEKGKPFFCYCILLGLPWNRISKTRARKKYFQWLKRNYIFHCNSNFYWIECRMNGRRWRCKGRLNRAGIPLELQLNSWELELLVKTFLFLSLLFHMIFLSFALSLVENP